MQGQGKPDGPSVKVDWQLDEKIVDTLNRMEAQAEMSVEEMVTIALRRYISQHKDYLPEEVHFK